MDAKLSDVKRQILSQLNIRNEYEGLDVQFARRQQFKATCPFHPDSDPSLSINDDSGPFHCFGCGKEGDAFKFYSLIKGLSGFPEILQGIDVDFNIQGSGPLTGKSTAFSEKVRGRSVVMTWAKREQYGGVS